VTSRLIAIPVKGIEDRETMFVAEDQEEAVPVKRGRSVDVAFAIAVRPVPNIGSMLKEVVKVKQIVVLESKPGTLPPN
jgi:hypothetical protein